MPTFRKVPPPMVPDPIPQKFTREQAIARLLAQGLTLADIQAEEEQLAAMHAIALLRARYGTPTQAPAVAPQAGTTPAASPTDALGEHGPWPKKRDDFGEGINHRWTIANKIWMIDCR